MRLVELAERGWLPDAVIRAGIRRRLRQRLQKESAEGRCASSGPVASRFADRLRCQPLVIQPAKANEQHYEVPARFFQLVLGRWLKYSCGYWPRTDMSLDASEVAMLELTCQRAEIEDGMQVLDLGCGWGSFTLWAAERFPACRVLAVSNSHGQREFIEAECGRRNLNNVEVTTTNVAEFDTHRRFDRVVSVEMFEHVRNYEILLHRIAAWLADAGKLFVHVFCHRSTPYTFEVGGEGDWMARHFFTGGTMPSIDLLPQFDRDLAVERQWCLDGTHYGRTCEAWLHKLDDNREAALQLLGQSCHSQEARRQLQRWRMFFMACAEMFNYRNGTEWGVAHYLFQPATVLPPGEVPTKTSRLTVL
jgi:cyclopropane-fatty-acyl-phospholipid synthase